MPIIKEEQISRVTLWILIGSAVCGIALFCINYIQDTTRKDVTQTVTNADLLAKMQQIEGQGVATQSMVAMQNEKFQTFIIKEFYPFQREVRETLIQQAARIDALQQKTPRSKYGTVTKE